MNGLNVSSRLGELKEMNEQIRKCALSSRENKPMPWPNLRKAQNEIEVAIDDAEDAKLEFYRPKRASRMNWPKLELKPSRISKSLMSSRQCWDSTGQNPIITACD